MAVSDDFAEFVKELFAPLGAIRTRRMFGGVGVYCDERMFALIADDELYLKTDDETLALFEAEGLQPFVFETKDGEKGVMRYRRAPESVFDDPDEAAAWGRLGVEAALRAAAKTRKPAKKRAKP